MNRKNNEFTQHTVGSRNEFPGKRGRPSIVCFSLRSNTRQLVVKRH